MHRHPSDANFSFLLAVYPIFLTSKDHIYKLMKSDSYSRFLRSNLYQDLLMARKKVSDSVIYLWITLCGHTEAVSLNISISEAETKAGSPTLLGRDKWTSLYDLMTAQSAHIAL